MSTDGSQSTPPAVPHRTRVVQLDAGQDRIRNSDTQTIVAMPGRYAPRAVPFEALFFAHYPAIRSTCRGLADPGVAVIAVHIPTCRLAGRLWLRAQVGRPATAIVGRHSRADLLLTGDRGMSLRHLALVLHPLRSWDGHDARFTVLDLRTSGAFHDETGRHLEGVRCEGPAMLSSGDYALFFLQTGDATDWPPLAGDAWAMLPQRVYLDERGAEPDRWQRRRANRRAPRMDHEEAAGLSRVTAIRGPVGTDEKLIREGEEPLGALNVLTAESARRVRVGPAALSRGILLGRYSRCDVADMLDDDCISRSHLLLLQVEGKVYAIDTASSHGSYIDGGGRQPQEFRVHALTGETTIVLADESAVLRWHPAR